jgi:hypothetical protein
LIRRQLHFPERLAEIHAVFHIYDATIFVDGDPVTRRRFSVQRRE